MHKSTRSFWLEHATQTSSGAYIGAILVWFSRGNEWMMLFWVALFVVLNLLVTLLHHRSSPPTYEKIKAQVDEKVDALRFRGLIPPEGLLSDADVKRLKAAGEEDFAICAYQAIHRCTSKNAKKAVKTL